MQPQALAVWRESGDWCWNASWLEVCEDLGQVPHRVKAQVKSELLRMLFRVARHDSHLLAWTITTSRRRC